MVDSRDTFIFGIFGDHLKCNESQKSRTIAIINHEIKKIVYANEKYDKAMPEQLEKKYISPFFCYLKIIIFQ